MESKTYFSAEDINSYKKRYSEARQSSPEQLREEIAKLDKLLYDYRFLRTAIGRLPDGVGAVKPEDIPALQKGRRSALPENAQELLNEALAKQITAKQARSLYDKARRLKTKYEKLQTPTSVDNRHLSDWELAKKYALVLAGNKQPVTAEVGLDAQVEGRVENNGQVTIVEGEWKEIKKSIAGPRLLPNPRVPWHEVRPSKGLGLRDRVLAATAA